MINQTPWIPLASLVRYFFFCRVSRIRNDLFMYMGTWSNIINAEGRGLPCFGYFLWSTLLFCHAPHVFLPCDPVSSSWFCGPSWLVVSTTRFNEWFPSWLGMILLGIIWYHLTNSLWFDLHLAFASDVCPWSPKTTKMSRAALPLSSTVEDYIEW